MKLNNSVLFLIALSIVLLLSSFCLQQPTCSDAYFNREGYVLTISMYDSTGRMDGRREITIGGVKMSGDTLITDVIMVSGTGEEEPERKLVKYHCVNNMYFMDGKSVLTAMNSQVPLAYVRFTELKLDMPQYALKLSVNDTLPDSDFRMAFQMRQSFGMKIPGSRLAAVYTNRTCTGIDTLIVAGISCVACVIELDFESNILAAREGSTTTGRMKEWFSPQYGVIRSEFYEKGKLSRYEMATAIKLPQ